MDDAAGNFSTVIADWVLFQQLFSLLDSGSRIDAAQLVAWNQEVADVDG